MAELPGVTSLYVGVNPVAEAFPSSGFSVYETLTVSWVQLAVIVISAVTELQTPVEEFHVPPHPDCV